MYLVGRVTRAHTDGPPQWEVIALRRWRSTAVRDCLADPVRLFYIKTPVGKLPQGGEAVYPWRPRA